MTRFVPILVISLGLVGITIGALVIGATLVDLDSDKRTHVFAARKTLSESLAIEYAILAASGQQSALEGALRALVARDTAIQSMAIQVIGGERLVVVGDHERYWIEPPVRQSTMTHMQVPIHKASSPWAMLQISFKPTHLSPEERWLTGAWPRFVAVVAVLTFIGALAIMRRTLCQLDPSEVSPPRVNEALTQEVEERKRIHVEREELNRKLLERSRSVGIADVASTVLHNVGNVLNSVNISVDVAMRALRRVPIDDIAVIASLLQQHRHELVQYLSEDAQGKQIPSYLTMLAESVTENHAQVESELIGLSRNVDHIRQVVDRQVHLARSERAMWEPVRFQNMMEQALAIHRPTLDRRGYEIVEQYDKDLEGFCDRHQVLQILVNLVSNAQKAMEALPDQPHRLTLHLSVAPDRPGFVRFEISDTGVGIASEHLPRLFTQGFTTRSDGHGIGLHSAMRAAKNLGGTLRATSDGPGRGATFLLDLPVTPIEVPV
jgi:signal transduction histidine kinase